MALADPRSSLVSAGTPEPTGDPQASGRTRRRYGTLLAALVFVSLCRVAAEPWLKGRVPFTLSLPVVLYGVWCCGVGGAVAVAGVSLALGIWLMSNDFPWSARALDNALSTIVYLGTALLLTAIGEAHRRARGAAEGNARQAALAAEEAQRQREAATRSEERLYVTLRSIGDGVIATDAEARVVLLNGVAEQLTGWSSEEAEGRDCREVFRIVNEHTRAEVESPVARVLREGRIVGLANHTLLIARDGAERMIDDSGAPIRDSRREIVGAILVFRDVSTQRRAEEELHRQARLLELAHDTVLVHDPDNRVVFWNRGAEEMYGWPREEAKGQLAYELLQTEFPGSFDEVRASLMASGYWEGELVHTRRDGRKVIVASRWALHRDAEGRPLSVLEINRDITAEKRSAEEIGRLNADLKRRADELQTVLDTVPMGISIAEDPRCERIWSNPYLSALLGVGMGANTSATATPAERPPYQLCRGGRELQPDEMPMQVAVAQGVALRDVDIDIVFDDGRVRNFVTSTAPLFAPDGRPSGCVTGYLDVTDRRRADEELARRAAEVADLNERLRRSMRETHHRVKNNLQIIAALIDLQVMKGRASVPTDELRRMGQHVRSLAAVHDLLTHEAGTDGSVEYLSTGDTMARLRPLVAGLVGDRKLTMHVEEMKLPVRQGTALAVLVNELASNAVKHGRGEIALALRASGGMATLEICDHGPGFPPGFDPRRTGTTGIELVENLSRWDLQGQVTYGHRPGGGARVVVRFPVADAPASP